MTCLQAMAQDDNMTPENVSMAPKEAKEIRGNCPPIYVTTSTGINNNTAIMGFSFDVPVSKKVSVDAGPGTGTWGYKLYAGVKYYMQPNQRGWALGAGLTYCPGVQHSWHDVTTNYGWHEHDEFRKNPQTNILFAAYRYWNLGKKYNRFYIEMGWSTPLSAGNKITQLTGHRINSSSENRIDNSAPGGPILAAGLSFGMH